MVGVEHYACGHIPARRFAEADARAVAAALEDACGVPRDHLFLLTSLRRGDLKATRANLVARLVRMQSSLHPEDGLIVYFPGHSEGADRAACWMTTDTVDDPAENLRPTGLDFTTLFGVLDAVPPVPHLTSAGDVAGHKTTIPPTASGWWKSVAGSPPRPTPARGSAWTPASASSS